MNQHLDKYLALIGNLRLTPREREVAAIVASNLIGSIHDVVVELPPDVRFLAITAGIAAALQAVDDIARKHNPTPTPPAN